MKALVLIALASCFAYAIVAHADEIPDCPGQPSVNNEQVLGWKQTTQNGYLNRGYVRGTLVGVIPHGPDHLHLDVFLGQRGQSGGKNDIEVIYNNEFGDVPTDLSPGMEVIACGDYITSNVDGKYPASPVGGILHWIHKSNSARHESGFLMIDGRLYGQKDAPPYRRHDWNSFGGADEILDPPCSHDQGNCGIH